jgi:hypothetical protein
MKEFYDVKTEDEDENEVEYGPKPVPYTESKSFYSKKLLIALLLFFLAGFFFPRPTPHPLLPPLIKNYERPLILYVYHENPNSRTNALYFIKHGLHSLADFVFILNGRTDLDTFIPQQAPNIVVIKRENSCYDLGAMGEVLLANDRALTKKYKRFIMLNSSIRGPFIPTWSPSCWTDLFLDKITDEVKLVGISYDCSWKFIQSMIFATDSKGLEVLLNGNTNVNLNYDKDSLAGLAVCSPTWESAISAEISLTNLMREASYKFQVFMTVASTTPDYYETCTTGNMMEEGKYHDISFHPYETVFHKSNRDISPLVLSRLTEWHDKWGYSSDDKCTAYYNNLARYGSNTTSK